jgi:DNA-binding MarR family transcriptional regulator
MHAVVTAELARRLTAESTLSYPEYEVLVALTDHPEGRLRPFEIAGRFGWEQSRVSHQVDRMVKTELVAKVRCDLDRRGWFVEATTAGRQAITSAAPGHVAAVCELFVDRLTDAQLATIASAAHDVLSAVDPAARE